MDNRVGKIVHGWEAFEDDICLSFDLPDEGVEHPCPVSSRNSFEFYPAVNPHRISAGEDVIIFCGRLMNLKTQESGYIRNTLLDQRDSFLRSQSFRFEKPSPSLSARPGGNFRYTKSHRSLIGPAKVPAEMELGDMKRRQCRRAPASMFPDGEVAANNGGGRKGHKARVKPQKCRTPLGMLSTALFRWVPNVC